MKENLEAAKLAFTNPQTLERGQKGWARGSIYIRKAKLSRTSPGDLTLQVTDLDQARLAGKGSIFSYKFAASNIPRLLFVRKKRRMATEWKIQTKSL